MSYCRRIGGAIVTFVEVDFNCPKCNYGYTEKDYSEGLYNSKRGLIYKSCKGCKTKLGITTDMLGDVHVWLKEDEKKWI